MGIHIIQTSCAHHMRQTIETLSKTYVYDTRDLQESSQENSSKFGSFSHHGPCLGHPIVWGRRPRDNVQTVWKPLQTIRGPFGDRPEIIAEPSRNRLKTVCWASGRGWKLFADHLAIVAKPFGDHPEIIEGPSAGHMAMVENRLQTMWQSLQNRLAAVSKQSGNGSREAAMRQHIS